MPALEAARDELRENPKQWEAFTSTGHCVVLAPPGSGKTKLLTTRLAEDLLTRIPHPHDTRFDLTDLPGVGAQQEDVTRL